jgi:hypothetical protein
VEVPIVRDALERVRTTVHEREDHDDRAFEMSMRRVAPGVTDPRPN